MCATKALTSPAPTATSVRVTLTRRGPRPLDGDNLQYAFKAVRDGIATTIGIDDGDARYVWEYAQERAKKYSILIQITIQE
jgi:hypothetical protein